MTWDSIAVRQEVNNLDFAYLARVPDCTICIGTLYLISVCIHTIHMSLCAADIFFSTNECKNKMLNKNIWEYM